MSSYCCFNCPDNEYEDVNLEDKCPQCGYKYGFPIYDVPEKISNYDVITPLDRGFYGVTYKVKDKLQQDRVLKIIPEKIYAYFEKNFEEECIEHADAAKSSNHIVEIRDYFDYKVKFTNDIYLNCHVAVLDYVEGLTLQELLNEENIEATVIAQVAIDLFKILYELKNKNKNHNDLHAKNLIIERLSKETRRAEEVNNYVRAVAIDLGSLSSVNKSGIPSTRIGDIHWVANFLVELSEKLLDPKKDVKDLNYRFALKLDSTAKLIFPKTGSQRIPDFEELIEDIRKAYRQTSQPWEENLQLSNLKDSYNAQTLDASYVPSLLVDPDNDWLQHISGKGPMFISGMRGCGKTMMLKALQFHARAKDAEKGNNPKGDKGIIKELKKEKYIGVYVSCVRLLNKFGDPSDEELHLPFSRLTIFYGLEIVRIIRHLKYIDNDVVRDDYYRVIGNAYSKLFDITDLFKDIKSDFELEQMFIDINASLNRGEEKYKIHGNPVSIFESISNAIRECSIVWHNKHVLFLLDDVSTRYLHINNIKIILSALIFQSEHCSFKITSEVQTLNNILFSPGMIEKAKRGRDYEIFDLGSAVNQKIRNRGNQGGTRFVGEILEKRAEYNDHHPKISPKNLLGDTSLISIARNIVSIKRKSDKKRIYHGLSALAGVCIGDIGDIIYLYDLIVRKYDGVEPIPKEAQNDSFNDLCSIRLQEINDKKGDYKDFALSFAQAAHGLLIESHKKESSRLRQYYSIYVRISEGNEDIYDKIRDLMDAGIFVYSGMSETPRTLGHDTDPINQFKLTYRRIFGISNLIGLTQADRFELSGEQVKKWINNPEKGKELLMNSVGGTSTNLDEGDITNISKSTVNIKQEENTVKQKDLFYTGDNENNEDKDEYERKEMKEYINNISPNIVKISNDDISELDIDVMVVALGFESRALKSIKRALRSNPKFIILVEYEEKGKAKDIIDIVENQKIEYKIISFKHAMMGFEIPDGNILLDITGMSKSIIFNSVKDSLKNNSKVYISHSYAQKYYPIEAEIKDVIDVYSKSDEFELLDKVSDNLFTGEFGPYESYDLLLSDTDQSKKRSFIGFNTVKYDKLFKILDNRNVDIINIINPKENGYNGKLINIVTSILKKKHPNINILTTSPFDLERNMYIMTKIYKKDFIDGGCNYEIGLTGNKIQTVAAGAISASLKTSNCWYVKPTKWDTDKFSKGTGVSEYFCIDI